MIDRCVKTMAALALSCAAAAAALAQSPGPTNPAGPGPASPPAPQMSPMGDESVNPDIDSGTIIDRKKPEASNPDSGADEIESTPWKNDSTPRPVTPAPMSK
jgi:hypothetical protein